MSVGEGPGVGAGVGSSDPRSRVPESSADPRMRVPADPYPGLRPFLDFEAALLFGRDRQVKEIIERLARTQFVAVLGGSGSGKSSVIHAGVIPELRSYGIPGAGDLWLPMVCTPGTNVRAEDSQARRHSPVTRLARRFEALLKPAADAAAAEARVATIASIFRQEAGFARLLDAYGDQLAVPPGPDPDEARVMFVIDQFEEIFHPTNQGVEDATVMVQRILDQFYAPHPHCYIVITMRSEHLNDCAAYLELPEAINKSFYLVRRLDPDELRQAIVGPAQRFLRLVARSAGAAAQGLPKQVEFEPAVVERLLRDVQALEHDPDHLPLLQHMLARLWQAAMEREEMDMPVPATITEIDLVRAVNGGAGGDEEPLQPELNALRACVENWPEKLYRWSTPPVRAHLEALFMRLGFKDPNTGLYLQQRVDVDDAAKILGAGKTRADLLELVSDGFLKPVHYLYWDADDPARVTLKVSHEAFIRGWRRFRDLIDQETAHYEEYVGLLRKCARWVSARGDPDFLLDTGDMRRVGFAGFTARSGDGERRATWVRLLKLERDGARLLPFADRFDEFLAASLHRRERQRKGRKALWAALGVTGLLSLAPAVIATYFYLVQAPTMRRVTLLLDAAQNARAATAGTRVVGQGARERALPALLDSAAQVDQARTGRGDPAAMWSERLFKGVPSVGLVQEQRLFLASVFSEAESLVNHNLRDLLTGSVWRLGSAPAAEPMPPPREFQGRCFDGRVGAAEPAAPDAGLSGRVVLASSARTTDDLRPQRAIFIPEGGPLDGGSLAFSASWNPADQLCRYGERLLNLADVNGVKVVFDAGLRYFAFALEGRADKASVVMMEMDWAWSPVGELQPLYRGPLDYMADDNAVATIRAAAGTQSWRAVPTWNHDGGRSLGMGAQTWRIVSNQARRLRVVVKAPEFVPMLPMAPNSACQSIRDPASVPAGWRATYLEGADLCMLVLRARTELSSRQDSDAVERDEVRVEVFNRNAGPLIVSGKAKRVAPLVSVTPYARVAAGLDGKGQWFMGVSGEHAGWLAMKQREDASGGVFIGLPMSTCALWRQGRELQVADAASASVGASMGASAATSETQHVAQPGTCQSQ